jgi:hypothetical protein
MTTRKRTVTAIATATATATAICNLQSAICDCSFLTEGVGYERGQGSG